jgi:hypothetical protein
MKRALRIDLTQAGRLSFTEEVTGPDALAQQCCVIAGTRAGSCRSLPDMGTDLVAASIAGILRGRNALIHAANFAATKVLFFQRATDGLSKVDERLQVVTLQVVQTYLPITLRLSLVTTQNRAVGLTAPVSSPTS